MDALSKVVGKAGSSSQSRAWVDMVLKRHRSLAAKDGQAARPGRYDISKERMQEQFALHGAAGGQRTTVPEEESRTVMADRSLGPRSAVPLPPPNQSPDRGPGSLRGAPQAHASAESHQLVSGARSQPASPVKGYSSRESRHQKARSMMDVHWR